VRNSSLVLFCGLLVSTAAHAQSAPGPGAQHPPATPQNDPAYLKKLEADPSFAGPERPTAKDDKTGSTAPGETRQYTPTKQLDEGTQQPR
jgi:hypothetical protein